MLGASLSEVWGDDFNPKRKEKKKKIKSKPLPPDEIDSELLIKESDKPVLQNEREQLSLLMNDRDENYSYQRINPNVVTVRDPYGYVNKTRPERIEDDPDYKEFLEYKKNKKSLEGEDKKISKIDEKDQVNELLLYIFTGFFLLILYDNIYRLGKKSY